MAKMTGKTYEEKGLRKLKAKYPKHDHFEVINHFLQSDTERVRQECLTVLAKHDEMEIFKQWREEYLLLQEIVSGFPA